ncbi:Hypothetical protein R9X50_00435500 [Acrodontium crateriforme]|uniref:Uncharacterized protein n=1 Tax=Acrodontium crateriforme TaxID=150365 RepID=A0AAQ3M595_9PEZI|nr:Hypothetical protein R9X50_00435500 [Acrodontium crateriforme]
MSDSETTIAVAHEDPHASMGGKSLASLERPRYKSWRKKYRKMRVVFDATLDENKRLYKEEIKLEAIAKRLREELDGLLELCLDLNQTPSLPAALRFDVAAPHQRNASSHSAVPANITPEQGDAILAEYTAAVRDGKIPPIDLHVIREQVERSLAAQDVPRLEELEARIPHSIPSESNELPPELKGDDLPGYLTIEQQTEHLLRRDAQLGDHTSIARVEKEAAASAEEKHLTDLTSRELDRQVEILNPQSQHNWLRIHSRINGTGEGDETESLASHETPRSGRKRGGGPAKNLAKQIGDRALGRAREGYSPGAASAMGDEDELGFIDEYPGSGRKRAKDPDGTYRVKGGGKSGKGSVKRKRASGDGAENAKKSRVDVD